MGDDFGKCVSCCFWNFICGVPSQHQLEVSLSDAELEAALANNTELFNPEYLTPLRQLEITLDDFDLEAALVNNTELFNPEFLDPLKRSASSRATTQCGCGYAPAAGRIVAGQEVNPMHSRPYQVYARVTNYLDWINTNI